MALLAETLVEEWLNRRGFFTIRGIKEGVKEVDLLAVKPGPDGTIEDALHVEVQVSFRPVAYVSKLTPEMQRTLNKGPNSAFRRADEMLRECVADWVDKKFRDPRKAARREALWPGVAWHWVLVHGVVMEPKELQLIEASGIRLVPMGEVLDDLCQSAEFTASAGTDLAELIGFYARRYNTAATPVRLADLRRAP